jgi:hypothetical protein
VPAPVPAQRRKPEPELPSPLLPPVPAVRQVFDAIALTSVIAGLALLLRISLLRF